MRYILQGRARNTTGNVIEDEVIRIVTSGTDPVSGTMAIVYETKTSSGAITSIITDSNGLFKFYIDTIDYGVDQLFDVLCAEIVYPDIDVFKMENAIETPFTSGGGITSTNVQDALLEVNTDDQTAVEVPFTPSVSASWDWESSPPVNVREALDDLITRNIDGGEF